MERELDRILSQDDVRKIMNKEHKIFNEVYIKYVYDGYTFRGGYRAIRKPKIRKKIQLEFHSLGYDKNRAKSIVTALLKEKKTI